MIARARVLYSSASEPRAGVARRFCAREDWLDHEGDVEAPMSEVIVTTEHVFESGEHIDALPGRVIDSPRAEKIDGAGMGSDQGRLNG